MTQTGPVESGAIHAVTSFFAVPNFFSWKDVVGYYKPSIWKPTSWRAEERLTYFYQVINVLGYFLGMVAGLVRIVFTAYHLFRGKNPDGVAFNSGQKYYLWAQMGRAVIELTGLSLILIIPDAVATYYHYSNRNLELRFSNSGK